MRQERLMPPSTTDTKQQTTTTNMRQERSMPPSTTDTTTNNTQQQQTTTNNKHETGKTYAPFNSLVYQENVQNMQRDNLLHPLMTQGTQLWNEKQ